jgi:PIN domain nuclease of toxin-antitoxin system
MRLLLDTHLLVWALTDNPRLDRNTRALIENEANDVLFSAVSIWEIAIKARLGRADFTDRSDDIAQAARDTGLIELPLHASAAALVADLPMHHRDPFDRILVAQAIAETLRFHTADARLPPYSELVTLVG